MDLNEIGTVMGEGEPMEIDYYLPKTWDNRPLTVGGKPAYNGVNT